MNQTDVKTNDPKALHETLRQIPYNLFAIGVGSSGGEENAFIGSWVTQCSFDPPMLAIAVQKDSKSYQLIESDGVFSVNLLSKDQEEIARKLVRPQHRVDDKLEGVSHRSGVTGAPILNLCLSYIECRVVDTLQTGGHVLVVGEAVNAEQNSDEEPLTCADIGWHYAG
ncbi:flavin reductase family protein [Pelagicoccus sp. SDUM812003]|uniref:flavin reductase family protein n=1 Tax=Pelagicoccus sp. SDUM812003 TaxID=3041267 RepID=UPI00280E810E|nr:flavin reductase family protein [Pelagicoccus sp. SDUM812003]MDQ8205045.1 flavin reductase family protein [Pelagicoccus sp. SDUM812003]